MQEQGSSLELHGALELMQWQSLCNMWRRNVKDQSFHLQAGWIRQSPDGYGYEDNSFDEGTHVLLQSSSKFGCVS